MVGRGVGGNHSDAKKKENKIASNNFKARVSKGSTDKWRVFFNYHAKFNVYF